MACACRRQVEAGSGSGQLSVAAVLHAALARSRPSLPAHHWKTLNALLRCRTPAMGGHLYRCEECLREHFVPHSCRNRHCPVCQKAQAIAWQQRQEACLLPVPYFHVVFTLPHELNALIAQNQRCLYQLLFAAASETLLKFMGNRFGVQPGITVVLHTWGQALGPHYHLHCIVTGGGLRLDGGGWHGCSPHYLLPVKALSVVFKAKYRDGIRALYNQGELSFHGDLAADSSPEAFRRLLSKALRTKWVIYAKEPFGGPAQVLAYLSRYTHRVAIGNGRLLRLDLNAGTVTFQYKDYAHGSASRCMKLKLEEFLRRFCLHILPSRFVKIRHFGFLSNARRRQKVAEAREAITGHQATPECPCEAEFNAGSEATPPTAEPPAGPLCPHCGSPRLVLLRRVHPLRRTFHDTS